MAIKLNTNKVNLCNRGISKYHSKRYTEAITDLNHAIKQSNSNLSLPENYHDAELLALCFRGFCELSLAGGVSHESEAFFSKAQKRSTLDKSNFPFFNVGMEIQQKMDLSVDYNDEYYNLIDKTDAWKYNNERIELYTCGARLWLLCNNTKKSNTYVTKVLAINPEYIPALHLHESLPKSI